MNNLSFAKACRMAAISKMGEKHPASSLKILSEFVTAVGNPCRAFVRDRWQASCPTRTSLRAAVHAPASD